MKNRTKNEKCCRKPRRRVAMVAGSVIFYLDIYHEGEGLCSAEATQGKHERAR